MPRKRRTNKIRRVLAAPFLRLSAALPKLRRPQTLPSANSLSREMRRRQHLRGRTRERDQAGISTRNEPDLPARSIAVSEHGRGLPDPGVIDNIGSDFSPSIGSYQPTRHLMEDTNGNTSTLGERLRRLRAERRLVTSPTRHQTRHPPKTGLRLRMRRARPPNRTTHPHRRNLGSQPRPPRLRRPRRHQPRHPTTHRRPRRLNKPIRELPTPR